MSHAYHSVRNQAMLKLYVIFNLLEVFDKLCASFGQDILDSLDASVGSRRRWRGGLALDFLIALVYTVLHTGVLFYHAVALNIALNSHNNLLITLLVSNNFVELKSNVFKRCEKENLFQVACADAVERFQSFMYVSIVALQFIFVQNEKETTEWTALGYSFALIIASEFAVDWVKHAFIVKFNHISPTVYSAFIHLLCSDARRPGMDAAQHRAHSQQAAPDVAATDGDAADVTATEGTAEDARSTQQHQPDAVASSPRPARRRGADTASPSAAASSAASSSSAAAAAPTAPSKTKRLGRTPRADGCSPSEFSALPAARMGFVPLPLLCLVIRVVGHDVAPRLFLGHPSGWLLVLLIWLVLCFIKVLTSITLLGYACARSAEAAATSDDDPHTIAAFLSGVERYSLHGKGIM
jgi:hypothetical protein